MGILTIDLPEPLMAYLETKAAEGGYTPDEYVRHLIRGDRDRDRTGADDRDLLAAYLAVSARQLDTGDVVELTADEVIARGRARRASAPA